MRNVSFNQLNKHIKAEVQMLCEYKSKVHLSFIFYLVWPFWPFDHVLNIFVYIFVLVYEDIEIVW